MDEKSTSEDPVFKHIFHMYENNKKIDPIRIKISKWTCAHLSPRHDFFTIITTSFLLLEELVVE